MLPNVSLSYIVINSIMCFGLILQLGFFTMFKEKHLHVHMMLLKFQSLKLWFVKNFREWNICSCCYHTEINELKEGVNGIRSCGKGIYG